MSMVDVFALCEKVTDEAFRLETRQRYNVPYEAPLIRAFEEGGPQSENESVTQHIASVNSLRAAGKRDYRVHVLELPLTSLHYELDAYRDNVETGEEIFITDRAWHTVLAQLTEDFMLLDGETDHASVVQYRDNDEVVTRDYSEDPADVAISRHHRDLAVAHAVRTWSSSEGLTSPDAPVRGAVKPAAVARRGAAGVPRQRRAVRRGACRTAGDLPVPGQPD